MKKRAILSSLLITALIAGLCSVSLAGGPAARLIPNGTVSLVADGKTVNQFKSEVPLPNGLLMVGEGNCVVQTKGLQLMVRDNSVFALSETSDKWDLTVKKGHVDFALRADAKPVTFTTPHEVIQSQQAFVKASTQGMVRGYIEVDDQETNLVVQEGALQTRGAQGTQLIEPGHGIRMAQATGGMEPNTPPPQNTTNYTPYIVGGVAFVAIGTGIGVAASQGGGEENDSDF